MEGQGGEGFRMDGKELRNGVLGHAEYWGCISVFLGYWKIEWKLRSHCGYVGNSGPPAPVRFRLGPHGFQGRSCLRVVRTFNIETE